MATYVPKNARPLQRRRAQPPTPIGPLESAGLGASQGATLGFGEEASAALEADTAQPTWQRVLRTLTGDPLPAVAEGIKRLAQLSAGRPLGEEMGGEGAEAARRGLTPQRVYREARDAQRERLRRAEDENPWSYGVGQFAGGLMTTPLMPGSAVSTTGRGIATAAGLGALGGLGAGEGEGLPGMLKDTAVGAGVGAGLGALGAGLGKAVKPVARKLREFGTEQARRVLRGGAQMLSVKRPVSAEAVREIVRSGAMPPGITTEGVAARLATLREQAGKDVGKAISRLEQANFQPPQAMELASRLKALALKAKREGSSTAAAAFQRAGRNIVRAETAVPGGAPVPFSLRAAEKLKRTLQDEANASFEAVGRKSIIGKAKERAAREVNKAIEEAVTSQSALDPAGVQAFRETKRRFGNIAQAEQVAAKGAVQAGQRQLLGLRDLLVAGAGGAIGGVPGLAAVPAFYLARTRGSSALARGAMGAGRGLEALRTGAVGRGLRAMEGPARSFLPGLAGQRATMSTPEEARARLLRRRRKDGED